MARANRLRGDGGIFHLTHRCHNRAFLLKFARDRDAYRAKVREHVQQFDLAVLDYCLTSNHVHLLVDAPDRFAISGFMREVASEFARAYNRRKHRTNAFWGDNYHATLVEGGEYLRLAWTDSSIRQDQLSKLYERDDSIFESLDTRYYKSSEVIEVFASRFALENPEDFR
jgi:REP element-mobilizing transposase RayT